MFSLESETKRRFPWIKGEFSPPVAEHPARKVGGVLISLLFPAPDCGDMMLQRAGLAENPTERVCKWPKPFDLLQGDPIGCESPSLRVARRTMMNQGLSFTSEAAPFAIRQTAKREFMPVDVAEVAAPRGEWILPAVNEVRLGLILSDYSAKLHSSKGLLTINVSAGSMSICEFNQPRRSEMRNPANVALVLLQNEILEQTLRDNPRQPRVALQERHGLQDHNMRHLMEILLYEKRQGFPSGAFFLELEMKQ